MSVPTLMIYDTRGRWEFIALSEPAEATRIKRALEGFIDQEVTPLGKEHPEFLGEDYERHVVSEDNHRVPEHREIVETIQRKC